MAELMEMCSPEFDEFGVVFDEAGIWYCSNKSSELFITHYTTEGDYLTRVYEWHEGKATGELITLPGQNGHQGPVVAWENGLIVSSTIPENREGMMGLFMCTESNGKWEVQEAFSWNGDDYSTMHPAWNGEAGFLVFSSNRPGGKGGYDLYASVFENGEWLEPVNLLMLNTDKNEVFPTVVDETLYFSSDREQGLGGLDIYYSAQAGQDWLPAIQLSAPYNSGSDDFHLVRDTSGIYYFSSNRAESDDIYKVKPPLTVACDTIAEKTCFTFYEKNAQFFEQGPLKYIWNMGDGTVKEGIKIEHCYQQHGHYVVQLDISDTLTGEYFEREALYYVDMREHPDLNIEVAGHTTIYEPINFKAVNKAKEPVIYYWFFDGELCETGELLKHYWTDSGTKNVTLMASPVDGEGLPVCVFKQIEVVEY